MGWTPPDGIEVPEWRCRNATTKEASVGEVTTIGLDLAKHIFQRTARMRRGAWFSARS